MKLIDGRVLRSQVYAAPGEHTDPDLSFDWIIRKFKRVTMPIICPEGQEKTLELLTVNRSMPMRDIICIMNTYLPTAL
jgi:hypothetical protein